MFLSRIFLARGMRTCGQLRRHGNSAGLALQANACPGPEQAVRKGPGMILLDIKDGPSIRSLADLPGLAGLRQVSARHNVSLTAHGSTLRFLVTLAVSKLASSDLKNAEDALSQLRPEQVVSLPIPKFDLFDVAPYSTDIDLYHSGDEGLTPAIFRSIQELIPNADCFRWELHCQEAHDTFREAQHCSAIIPVNLMTLSTESRTGIEDPWRGLQDLVKQQFRYIRNGFFRESPLYQNLRDLELLSALSYFRIVLHSGVEISSQPGAPDAFRVVLDALDDPQTYLRLEDSSYLRAKLTYRLISLRAAARSQRQFDEFMRHSRLVALVRRLPISMVAARQTIRQIPEYSGRAIVTSAWLGGDRFRLPPQAAFQSSSDFVQSVFESVAHATVSEVDSRTDIPELGENQRMLLASEPITVTLGGAEYLGSIPQEDEGQLHEFACFAIGSDEHSPQKLAGLREEDISALVAVTAQSKKKVRRSLFIPTPCAVKMLTGAGSDDTLLVRVNLRSCLNALSSQIAVYRTETDELTMRVFIVAWEYNSQSQSAF